MQLTAADHGQSNCLSYSRSMQLTATGPPPHLPSSLALPAPLPRSKVPVLGNAVVLEYKKPERGPELHGGRISGKIGASTPRTDVISYRAHSA